MKRAKFNNKLDMGHLKLKGSLFMSDGAEFADVTMSNATVDGKVSMEGSKFRGQLDADKLKVGTSMFMRDKAEFKEVKLSRARIGADLDLAGSTLSSLDLTGSQVFGEFRLGSETHGPVVWRSHKGAKLILRNTEVGVPEVTRKGWPDKLELEGFIYSRLGGFGTRISNGQTVIDVDWFPSWLERQSTYSPQPYEQLAGVLRKSGHRDKASALLYWSRERQRTEVASGLDWW